MVLVVALLATSAAACADEAGSGGSRSEEGQEYVDAIVAASGDAGATDEENECLARSFVDAIGLDELREAVTPAEIEENPDSSPADMGIPLDEEQADAFWDDLNGCMDVEALFIEGIAEDEALSDEDRACLEEAFDDDLIKQIMVGVLVEGEDSLEGDDELMGELFGVYSACPGAVPAT
ncbi:MAG: hypothetical protein ACRDZN_07600 [Acidimicrobiales bacterium]